MVDHNQHPVASVAVTYPDTDPTTGLSEAVATTAAALTRRIGGA